MSSISLVGALAIVSAMLVRPASSHDPQCLFETETAAVLAAANAYNPLSISEDREYMGAIYRDGEQFGFSVTAGARGNDTMKLRIPEQHLPNIVAFWHTHGRAGNGNRYFSAVDTKTASQFGKPFYLADYTGYLKVFRPGDATMSPFVAGRLSLPTAPGFAIGTFVRDQFNRLVRVKVNNGDARVGTTLSGVQRLS